MINVETKKVEKELLTTYSNPFGLFNWANNENIMFTQGDGLFLYNLETGFRRKIKCLCNEAFYSFGSMNRNHTKLAFIKTKCKLLEPGSHILIAACFFALIDSDGKNEVEIEIPE